MIRREGRRVLLGAGSFTLIAGLVLVGCSSGTPQEPIDSDGSQLSFNHNNLLSDAELTDATALTADQIQAFLENNHCGSRSSLADYSSHGKTAAQAMAEAATRYQISPIEFLARLQTESSLVCSPASQSRMDAAFGCGCPDGGGCAPQYAGFDRQVDCAGKAFRSYLDDIASEGQTVAGWAPHRTSVSSDGYSVTPENAATAALYTYTPWVYNGGNKLHWQVWHDITDFLGAHPQPTHSDSKPDQSQKPQGCQGPSCGGCTDDAQCNHGAGQTGLVCANDGPERGTCIEGCHADADCPSGSTCDQSATPHWACSPALPPLNTDCTQDSDCNKGQEGTGRVCAASTKKCILGCHDDSSCSGGAVCDKSNDPWVCIKRKEIGDDCAEDRECNGGIGGTQRVCGNDKKCADACHSDYDCPKTWSCSHETERWSCKLGAAPAPEPSDSGKDLSYRSDGNTCPVVEFPSGVRFQLKPDADLTAVYNNHLGDNEAPTCFIDVDDLFNPATGERYDYAHVMVSEHFYLQELVGTDIEQGWGRRVVLNPDAVRALEAFRVQVGMGVTVTSGYRSPRHQEAICAEMCGDPMGCDGTCANSSRHLFGDAFDLSSEFYTRSYAQQACDAGFHYSYAERCDHLHVDMNPNYASCIINFDRC